MESLMASSTLPPLFADEDGSKESNDLATSGLTHPEGPYGSAATSTTNPEFVEDLSQGQLLQSEASNAVEGNEQRPEDEVSEHLLSLSTAASKAMGMQGGIE
uniref:Isoform 4 of High mobility group protein 20A n=1 Tax=Mus musculus TaxID=10090 RepID=Q9DC33-4|nr:unnamed protein product [Mus musculus]